MENGIGNDPETVLNGTCEEEQFSVAFQRLEEKRQQDAEVKEILRKRIADVTSSPSLYVTAKNVYLFPTGMSAFNSIAEVLKGINPQEKLAVVVYE